MRDLIWAFCALVWRFTLPMFLIGALIITHTGPRVVLNVG